VAGLRSNPSLDARWAMQAIDRLLDERPRPGQVPADLPGAERERHGLLGRTRSCPRGRGTRSAAGTRG